MARQKSELLSAPETTFQIVEAIVDGVLDLGGNDEEVRRILKNKDLPRMIAELLLQTKPVITPTLHILVNYNKSLQEMVKAGEYAWVDSNIASDNFPIQGKGRQKKEVVFFRFRRKITSENVIAEMDSAGYRPASIEVLLAIGASYPELQKQFPIIALGSRWWSPGGYLQVPFLYCWDSGERYLGLCWWLDKYLGSDWRFVALRK